MPHAPVHSGRPRRIRFAVLAATILAATNLAGLVTVPTEGADRLPEHPEPAVAMPAAQRWRLRPTEPSELSVPTTTGSLRGRSDLPLPGEHRAVRLVYPALIEAR